MRHTGEKCEKILQGKLWLELDISAVNPQNV